MLNPFIAEIDGDLSRADAVVLVQTCRNRDVVEFGVGASTILLSQCARSLVSLDTEQHWIDRTRQKIDRLQTITCRPEYVLIEKNCQELPKFGCDVLFNDGHSLLRVKFLQQYWLEHVRESILLHDARTHYATNMIREMMSWYDKANYRKEDIWEHNPYVGCLRQIDWCPQESNMVVLHKRNCSLRYENWNLTERGGET